MVPRSGDDSIDLALQSYRQGDILPDVRSVAATTPRRAALSPLWDEVAQAGRALLQTVLRRPSRIREDRPGWERTPNGVVIISQTCDVVRSHRERRTIQAAKLVRLKGDTQREAADGRRPRFVAVPNAGVNRFADLEVIGTIDKQVLVALSREPGVVGDDQVRKFAAAGRAQLLSFSLPGRGQRSAQAPD